MRSVLSRVVVPEHVLFRELDGEAVLLNLGTEAYVGLDAVATRLWTLLTSTPSIQAACDAMRAEYDVDPDVLSHDVDVLLGQMLEHGLVELKDA